jgi:toxin ParE1/3/4
MAQVIWSEPALTDLDDIAEYIALSNPQAACALVQRVMETVERLELFPKSGKIASEISELGYREVVASPCRVFYREEAEIIYIIHVYREERDVRKFMAGN